MKGPERREEEEERTYQICRLEADHTTECNETVKGLGFAQTRVAELDATSDARHFIFDPISEQTIESRDLSPARDLLLP
jgi:hypothetical protein